MTHDQNLGCSADRVAEILGEIGAEIEAKIVQLPSAARFREVKHMTPIVHSVLTQWLGIEVVTAKVLPVPTSWPSLGGSTTDVVVETEPGSRVPRHVAELKWCQPGAMKVEEDIWDLLKMACMIQSPTVETAHLVTGAPAGPEGWDTALCADVFDSGTVDVEELCSRRYPNGRPIWDWMLEGGDKGRGWRYPRFAPAQIVTMSLPRVSVRTPDGDWEIRCCRVSVEDPAVVDFPGGWPRGSRPTAARFPIDGWPA